MNVVFDLGNVLLRWDPRFLFRTIFADEQRMEWFLANVCNLDWILARDRGSSYAEGVREASRRFPDFAGELQAFNDRWHETLPGVIPETAAMLRKLHDNGVPLYAITNFNDEKFDETLPRFPELLLFRDIIVSGREKLLKPEAAIYQLLLARQGLQAEDCLFIDDNAHNVEGACAVGMHGHHFTSPAGLAAELRGRGLLTD
jgi:HAD superfamily hydrolase (TIGR01509 family)